MACIYCKVFYFIDIIDKQLFCISHKKMLFVNEWKKRLHQNKSIKKGENREYGLNQIVTDVQKALYVHVLLSFCWEMNDTH